MLNNFHNSVTTTSYPPYNIIKVDEDDYTIEMAVAGFSKNDIEIVQQEQTLTIEGKKDKEDTSNYVHRGIAARDFKHTFALADYVEVESAKFTDGILSVKIKREVPEEKKPRTITVK
jgi:molecular chaperone IbpA